MPRKEFVPMFTKLWSSSHGTEAHFLPSALEAEFKGQKKFSVPVIDAYGGRRLDNAMVLAIKQNIDREK